MTRNTENSIGQHWPRLRAALWAVAALILLAPLVAMQFTAEVKWDLADFAVAGALLVGVGLAFELAVRKTGNFAYRAAVGVALAAAFMLVWVNLAVGIIGDEGNDANLMYGGVLAVGIIGAIIARFHPQGLARVLFAVALGQALVAVIALIAGFGYPAPTWPWGILMFTGFFAALWLISAWLFRKAAREQATADAESSS